MGKRFQRAREIARDCWIESKGDAGKARALAEQRVRSEFGSLATVILIIQFVVALINFWNAMHTMVPSEQPLDGEPSFSEECE